jgi:hypothetical protein
VASWKLVAQGILLEHALSPKNASVGRVAIKLRGHGVLKAVIETELHLQGRDLRQRD